MFKGVKKLNENNIFILHITINLEGGVGTVIKNLIEYQLSKGYSVGLYYGEINRDKEIDYLSAFLQSKKFNLYQYYIPIIKTKLHGNLVFGLPLKKIITKIKTKYPDKHIIIHAHNAVSIGIFNNYIIRELPVVCTLHGTGSSQFLIRRTTNFILKQLYKNGNQIVAVSNYTANEFNKLFKEKVITTIHNGVKIKKIIAKNESNVLTIGYAARIDSLKGWRELLMAFNMLMPEYRSKIKLIIAGDGPEVDAMLITIKKLNLQNDVEFLGYISNAGDTLIPFFDVFVLPSKNEGLPMSILEAFGHGVPVIATDVGGISEIIENEVNGLLLINGNPEYIKNSLLKLIKNPELYRRLQNNSLTTYKTKFNIKKMSEEYLKVYKKLAITKSKRI